MSADPTTTAPGFAADARAALLEIFASHGLVHGDGANGEILLPFEHEGRRLVVAARVGDSAAAGIWLQLIAADPIGRAYWGETLVAVNRWNSLVACPRAVLRAGDWDADTDATLTLDVWLPFGDSGVVDPSQIAHVVATVLAATSFFACPPEARASDGMDLGPSG